MARIIYYGNLDYDQLPTAKKRRISEPVGRSSAYISSTIASNSSLSSSESACMTQTLSSSSGGSNPYSSPALSEKTQIYNYESPPFERRQQQQPRPKQPQRRAPPQQLEKSPYWQPSSAATTTTTSSTGFQSAAYHYENTPPHRPTYDDDFHSPSIIKIDEPARARPKPLKTAGHQNLGINQCRKPVDQKRLLDTLKRYFKFNSFRQNQLEAVNATCQGQDTLVLMPTGGGKSICYQLPAIVTEGITIVVSPLKSLIEDQVTRLRDSNIKTSALSSNTSESELSDIYRDLKQPSPEHKLLYVTPEKINASQVLIGIFDDLYSRGLLARFVIDEAHCVSTWGADFRPDYRKLGKLRELYPEVPIMALTATAPPQVRNDIFNQLQMDKQTGKTFIQSFNRPNLKFEVHTKSKGKDSIKDVINIIKTKFIGQCGIIYCLSRNDCETLATKLRDESIWSAPYHAGLTDNQRKATFDLWSKGKCQVVCATIAFGMGIDKSDVRFVIHHSLPKSLEGYYQEAGRAGRDGQFASCILFFSKSDVYRLKSMLSKGFGRQKDDRTRDRSNLDSIVNYVENTHDCRRAILLRYLGEEFDSNDCISHIKTACDNCSSRRRR